MRNRPSGLGGWLALVIGAIAVLASLVSLPDVAFAATPPGHDLLTNPHLLTGLFAAGITAPAARQLKDVLTELKKLQTDFTGKVMPEDVAKQFETLAAEAKAMQDEHDRAEQIKRFERFGATVDDPALPAGGEQKGARDDAIAGYISAAEWFAFSPEMKAFYAANMPKTAWAPTPIIGSLLGIKSQRRLNAPAGFIPVTKAMREVLEAKTLPSLGTGVIEPQRLAEIVRATENQTLGLRDILNVSSTSSDTIEWVRRTSFTRAASTVAPTTDKPEAATVYAKVSTAVKTHAVTIPVTEQQLQDAAQIINLIETDLLHDLRLLEEELVMYGDGTGDNFEGICVDSDVTVGRTASVGTTTLDKIRVLMTDVRLGSYNPTAVAIHPIDWEAVVLLKGSDSHYIWVVVTDAQGPRLWGLRAVELLACQANRGDTTEERNLVVGDWPRAATLWDRQQANIAVGWVDDQFKKNMRTIRAEHRTAFAIRRPGALKKYQTQAAVP
jgi:HK97 family phage major capsid protein